jgi:glycosyltransferase involved in cell wall biosynthesis
MIAESAGVPRSVSVVIASGAGEEYIFRCLDSLRAQAAAHGAEVIVVDRFGGDLAARIERDYGFVDLVRPQLDRRPSVPELRAIGVARARGDIVAVIEEHCAAGPGWLETVANAWQEGDAALGGPVLDSAFRHPRDWAIYFSEFHNYLPPWPSGPRYALNGVNIAYSRALLNDFKGILGDGYWEVVLHPRLAERGAFRAIPGMQVHHAGPFNFRTYLKQRYLLSRVWGAGQRQTASAAKRTVYLLAAPFFPALLLLRIALCVARSPRYLKPFMVAFPLLIPIAVTYVWGEWSGYAFGMGDALERVE